MFQKKLQIPAKLYVYKEYSDWLAYGEELILLFSSRDEAVKLLRHRVENHFHETFENIQKAYDDDEWSDSVREDYVSIVKNQRGCLFWVIEEHSICPSADNAIKKLE